MKRLPIKFRLLQDNSIVGYEKWYPGSREGGKEYGDFKAFPEWLYSIDNKNWFPSRTSPITQWYNLKNQSTGLEDKNGVEIWEGDVVRTTFIHLDGKKREEVLVVEKDTCNPSMLMKDPNDSNIMEFDFIACDLRTNEVIGNVFENPELLSKEK